MSPARVTATLEAMPPWDMVEALGTWFAGIATAGSLWVGFTILRNDRKRQEREQASRVSISPQFYVQDDVWFAVLKVWNHSEQPVSGVRVVEFLETNGIWDYLFPWRRAYMFHDLHTEPAREEGGWLMLLPGESAHLRLNNLRQDDAYRFRVIFMDIQGIDWKYTVSEMKLSKSKRRTIIRRGEGDRIVGIRRPIY